MSEALEDVDLSPAEPGCEQGPTFVVHEGPGLTRGTLEVGGRLCTAEDVAALLDQVTSLAALGVQEVTVDLAGTSSISEAATDALLELAVEATPTWLAIRLEGWTV